MISNETHDVFIEYRSQKSKGSFPNRGPDTYIAVQIVPKGTKKLIYLNSKVAEKRNIIIKYFGEGYSNRCTSEKSALNQAKAKALNFVNNFKKGKINVS